MVTMDIDEALFPLGMLDSGFDASCYSTSTPKNVRNLQQNKRPFYSLMHAFLRY